MFAVKFKSKIGCQWTKFLRSTYSFDMYEWLSISLTTFSLPRKRKKITKILHKVSIIFFRFFAFIRFRNFSFIFLFLQRQKLPEGVRTFSILSMIKFIVTMNFSRYVVAYSVMAYRKQNYICSRFNDINFFNLKQWNISNQFSAYS